MRRGAARREELPELGGAAVARAPRRGPSASVAAFQRPWSVEPGVADRVDAAVDAVKAAGADSPQDRVAATSPRREQLPDRDHAVLRAAIRAIERVRL